MTDLLPCPNPWCHSHTCTMEPCCSLDRPRLSTSGRGGFYALCGSCGLQGPRASTKEEALARWNDRPSANKGGQYWWAKWKEVKAVLDKAIKLTPMADAYKADVKDFDRRSDGSVISPYGENNPPIGDGS